MIVVMYHYVRDECAEYPNFKVLTVDRFREQIEFFDKTYGLIAKEDFIHSLDTKSPIEEGVILTFDDGFKDHYCNVLPILAEKKAWGFFYVPTGHYKDKKILDVHRVHHLLGKYNARSLLSESLKLIDASMLNEDMILEFDKEIYREQQLSTDEYQLKRLFNYYLRAEYKTQILDEITMKYLNENELYDKLYLTKGELREMEKYGSIIGSHTVTHPVLSTLTYEQQKKEVEESYSFLNTFLDIQLKSFCYPYGGLSTYNQNTLKVLEECGVHHAFTAGNKPLDNIENVYTLARMDCNRF